MASSSTPRETGLSGGDGHEDDDHRAGSVGVVGPGRGGDMAVPVVRAQAVLAQQTGGDEQLPEEPVWQAS